MNKIRILLADDHPMVRSGLIKLLEPYKEFVVVGEAGDGEEAVAMTKKLEPDIVIIDLSMPKLSGIEATKLIRKNNPTTKVLVLTMHDNEEYVYQIFKCGAGGYMLKNTGKDDLAAAIRAVAKGETFFSPRVSEIMVNAYLRKADVREELPLSNEDVLLTKREKEILFYIADGLNNSQIAEKLFISARTVDTHRTNIMQKLDIHDAANLVRYALSKKEKHRSNP
ncbi:MAG: response regulator transcription factor [Ignavibacteriales bacterium]|nr:response regulator transcription factor [Ignavibacteriales bacterium]